MPKLVVGNKRDQVSPQTKRASGAPELRGVETMEAVGYAGIRRGGVFFAHAFIIFIQTAEPFSLDTNVFYGFLDRVTTFANAQASGHDGGSTSSDYPMGSGTTSAFAADGLRQTNKTRPLSPSMNPPMTPGKGSGTGGWWR
jgi:hypothetical protein